MLPSSSSWRDYYDNLQYRKAAELLQSVEIGDDVECLLILGTLYLYGAHTFESEYDYVTFMRSDNSDAIRQFWKSNERFAAEGVKLLERASELGCQHASESLLTYYSASPPDLPEEVRRAKAIYYYAQAASQQSQKNR